MPSDALVFRDLAYVFVAAVLGGGLAWAARQPLILGYVFGGLLISPFTPGPAVSDVHTFEVIAEVAATLEPGTEDITERQEKFEALIEILEPLLAEGHKVLVFSQFVSLLTIVRSRRGEHPARRPEQRERDRDPEACAEVVGGGDIRAAIGFHSGLKVTSPGDAARIKGKVLAAHRVQISGKDGIKEATAEHIIVAVGARAVRR